jgi:hypothetical protein
VDENIQINARPIAVAVMELIGGAPILPIRMSSLLALQMFVHQKIPEMLSTVVENSLKVTEYGYKRDSAT